MGDGLELLPLLLLCPEYWDYRYVPPHPHISSLLKEVNIREIGQNFSVRREV